MENPVSVVDTLMAQRNGVSQQSQQVPSNPLLRGVDTGDFASLTKALFGAGVAQQTPEPPKNTELDWLLKDTPKPATSGAAGSATQTQTQTQTPTSTAQPQTNFLSSEQQRMFKADFSLFDDKITTDSVLGAVADAYKPGGGLQAVTVPAEMLTAFASGDFSGLAGLLHMAQVSAHQNAMSGVLNMLNALLPQRMGELFNKYSSHADEVSARTSISEQHTDPLLQLTLDAALSRYKAKYPNATTSQLKAVSDNIASALKERLAPKANDAQATPQPQPWDEFFTR